MKITTDINEINELLADYQGGQGMVAYFSHTMTKLALLLTFQGMEDVIYLTGINCKHFEGPFHFTANSLSVNQDVEKWVKSISDPSAGLVLKCGEVILLKGRSEQFSESLDDFIKDKSQLPE